MEFSRTTLNIDTLLFAYGPDPIAVDERLAIYAKEKTILLKDKYFFRLSVTQKGIETITHIIYYVVEKGTKGSGLINSVDFKHHNFVEVSVTDEEFLRVLTGENKDALDLYFKNNHLKLDMTSIFAMYQDSEGGKKIYYQYKEK